MRLFIQFIQYSFDLFASRQDRETDGQIGDICCPPLVFLTQKIQLFNTHK